MSVQKSSQKAEIENNSGAPVLSGPTRGPWSLDGAVVRGWTGEGDDLHERPICEVYREVRSTSETIANAHLLVAAPDLLAAVQSALSFIESEMHYSQPAPDMGEEPSDQFTYDAIPVAMELQAALAKAVSVTSSTDSRDGSLCGEPLPNNPSVSS